MENTRHSRAGGNPAIADWIQTEIGEIADVIAGGTPKAGDPDNFAEPGTGIAWLTPADLSGYDQKYIAHGKRDLSKQGYDSSSAKLMRAGSLLFSSRAPIGYVAIAQNDISTNQGFKNFVFTEHVSSDFAYHYLCSIRELAESLGTGTTFKEISGATAKTLPFILPPLAEQKVIAYKLDTLLAQVETTKARLERIPEILKTFRQSVLAAAVSGKLTEEWRSIQKIKPEIKDYRQHCLDQRKIAFGKKMPKVSAVKDIPNIDLPASWRWQSLDEISIKITDGTHHSPKSFLEGDYMYVTSKNVREGYIDLSNISYIDEETHREIYSRCDVKLGDVLYVKDGANTGLSCVNNINEEISLLSSLGVLKVCSFMSPVYVQHYLNSPTGRKLMLDMMGGTAIKRLTLTKISISPIPVPHLKEQTEIVRRVEELFAFADIIELKANAALDRVKNLTQSILAKAFRGELTAEWRAANPNLISGDNSAEALLAKIKAKRETIKKQPKPKRAIVKKKKGSLMSKQIIKVVDALKEAKKPLNGQELLAAAGYPSDSTTDQLEQFFLDLREALTFKKSIVKLGRSDDGQDWFALTETVETNKA